MCWMATRSSSLLLSKGNTDQSNKDSYHELTGLNSLVRTIPRYRPIRANQSFWNYYVANYRVLPSTISQPNLPKMDFLMNTVKIILTIWTRLLITSSGLLQRTLTGLSASLAGRVCTGSCSCLNSTTTTRITFRPQAPAGKMAIHTC